MEQNPTELATTILQNWNGQEIGEFITTLVSDMNYIQTYDVLHSLSPIAKGVLQDWTSEVTV